MAEKKDRALRWPYGIAFSFVLIIALIVGTIIVASNNKVSGSDLYMQNYHAVDSNINDIIMAQIAFNKLYQINYTSPSLDANSAQIVYEIMSVDGKPVNDAIVDVVLTRPNTHDYDLELSSPTVNNGVYTFAPVALPKEGRWDIMAKVQIGDQYRFYNLKADTRNPRAFEY